MDTFLQDLRYAVRAMTRRKAVTALAVLTFGLGIAPSTAMFSVVDAVLLKPLPYEEPHEIVSVYTRNEQFAGHPTLGFAAERGSFSTPEFNAVRDNGTDVLDGVAILSTGGATLYGEGEPERIPIGITTTDLFARVLRVNALHGRLFEEEDARSGERVVLLEEAFWRSRFGADPELVGRDTRVGGVAADIHDEEVQSGTPYAFYVPRRQAGQLGGTFVLRTAGSPAALAPALRQRVREVHNDIAIISVQPLSELLSEQIASQRYRARLIVVFSGLAALFSLMGIYGVTARSVAARTRELGIRMALGARRSGVVGLVLRQAIRLAVAGAAIGIVISLLANRAIETYLWGVRAFDPLTLIAIALLLGAASVLAALAPGLRASRIDPMEALRAE